MFGIFKQKNKGQASNQPIPVQQIPISSIQTQTPQQIPLSYPPQTHSKGPIIYGAVTQHYNTQFNTQGNSIEGFRYNISSKRNLHLFDLETKLLELILAYVGDLLSLRNVMLCCKTLYRICKEGASIWHSLYNDLVAKRNILFPFFSFLFSIESLFSEIYDKTTMYLILEDISKENSRVWNAYK